MKSRDLEYNYHLNWVLSIHTNSSLQGGTVWRFGLQWRWNEWLPIVLLILSACNEDCVTNIQPTTVLIGNPRWSLPWIVSVSLETAFREVFRKAIAIIT